MNDFDEYIRQGEPDKIEKSQIWQTAIGLQQVDGLTPSAYLIETAKENIEGKITIDEVKSRIDTYYITLTVRNNDDDRTEEADKVSARIAEVLGEKALTFSHVEFINIHKRLFSNTYKFAGKVRDYDISKNEWVLNGKSVMYASAYRLRNALEHDFNQEKTFDYKGLTPRETVEHIAKFISNVWQAHVFGEGNTRTTAVFAIKYLRTFGFEVENDMFAQHSWYFRNALVRANYNDALNNINASQEYLMRFFGNVLFGEHNDLKNRYLHISFKPTDDPNVNRSGAKLGVKLQNDTVNAEKFLVNGKKFLVNGEKFPVIGLEILKLIEQNPKFTIIELSKQLNISDRAVKNNINKLKNAGIISREGADKNGYWKINNN
jgi:fido (protein-threonine AMPylation protein)/DNA-binding transcriptional ArsR family regulator